MVLEACAVQAKNKIYKRKVDVDRRFLKIRVNNQSLSAVYDKSLCFSDNGGF